MDRDALLAPLGKLRLQILDCLGGNSPYAPSYFDIAKDVDVIDQFDAHTRKLPEQWAEETDPLSTALLAATRLLSGDVQAAKSIFDCFPKQMKVLDHGAGICVVAPFRVLSAALPLPARHSIIDDWVAESAAQQMLHTWLHNNIPKLEWNAQQRVYIIRTDGRT